MKVFISWSGDLSKGLAEILRDWLPSVIQSIRPFFTPDDIEKGARWSNDISRELEESQIGIFCLTKENLTKPWIMFEAGALSKQIGTSKVCPILFDVDNADLVGPLVQFQTVHFCQDDIRKLIQMLNNSLKDNQLDQKVLDKVFTKWWPDLESNVQKFLENYRKSNNNDSKIESRSDREVLEEILELSRLKSEPTRMGYISPMALEDLFDSLLEIKKALNSFDSDASEQYFKRLRKPLEHLIQRVRSESIRSDSLNNQLKNLLDSLEL